MSDPMDALALPADPIDPDPAFAADLRRRLEDALLVPVATQGEPTMTDTQESTHAAAPWPPAITPYIMVSDARRAIDWYVDVFGGHRRGEPHVSPDGTIGHAEVGIGDAALMLAEPSDLYPDVPVAAPDPAQQTFSHTIHLQVDDVDGTVTRAGDTGATVERQPTDEPYGRAAVIVDPFGHRWLLLEPPKRATRVRHGDIGYVTVHAPDDERAKAFYGAVLGWRFTPGRVERGWQIEDRTPGMGLHGDPGRPGGAELCYRVADIAAAVVRVRAAGGRADDPERQPHGLMASCTDDQGIAFYLWEPTD